MREPNINIMPRPHSVIRVDPRRGTEPQGRVLPEKEARAGSALQRMRVPRILSPERTSMPIPANRVSANRIIQMRNDP